MAWRALKSGAQSVEQRLSSCNSIITYASLLQDVNDVAGGKMIHNHWRASGLNGDLFLENQLVSMYGRCGSLENAREVFDQMAMRNVFSWTLMISAFAHKGHFESALKCFMEMLLEGMTPNKVTLLTILKACANAGMSCLDFSLRLLHSCAAESGLDSDAAVATSFVNACGGCEDAQRAFSRVEKPDIILWNALIAAYDGNSRAMLVSFRRMQLDGVRPDAVTFSTVLSSCGTPSQLKRGKIIHETIVEAGYEADLVVGNALLGMYRNCGSLEDAMVLFRRMETRDIITWNSLIAACAEQHCFDEALQLHREMQTENVPPDKLTLSSLLNACAALMDVAEGKRLHDRLAELGIQPDAAVGTALVNMYGKCGDLDSACQTFENLLHKDVATWTVYMGAHSDAGENERCFEMFRRMQHEGVHPNKITFFVALNACSSLEEARLVHSYAAAAGLEADASVSNTIINAYGSCGSVDDAELMFARVQNRDLVSWNSLMKAHAEAGHPDEVLKLYLRMQLEGLIPDKFTFVTTLNSCNCKRFGGLLHRHAIETGEDSNGIVENALVAMLAKCGEVDEARRRFDKMEERTVVTWTAMIDAFTEMNSCREALVLFQRMQAEGVKPNSITLSTIINWSARLRDSASSKALQLLVQESGLEMNINVANALLNLYGKFGRLKQALSLFNRMVDRDHLSWNLMIASHAQHGYARESLRLLEKMKQDGMKPDEATFVNVLAACSHRGLVQQGCEQFGFLSGEYGVPATSVHCGCIVDLLGRAGHIAEAQEFMRRRGMESSVSAWTSLLGACTAHARLSQGKIVAEKLLELDPRNSSAYISLSNLFSGARQQSLEEQVQFSGFLSKV